MFAFAAATVVLIGQTPRANPSPPLWDIRSLGGFSVASTIFIASLGIARALPGFATVGMLLVTFLILVFRKTGNVVP